MNIEKVLEERGSKYGRFMSHAEISQDIKAVMHSTENWHKLSVDKMEALDMIAHKIARVLNGDPEHADNFVDIAGYATLVADKIIERNGK